MKPGPCQVRSRTQSPCLDQAVVEILGIPFCEACAREQEVYFAIGELTQGRRSGTSELSHLENRSPKRLASCCAGCAASAQMTLPRRGVSISRE
jgi:hypothetical protein